MSRRWGIRLLALAVLALGGAGQAQAGTISAVLSTFSGDPASVRVTLDDVAGGAGNIEITVEVLDPPIGDIRALFLNIDDDSLLAGLSVLSGVDITQAVFSGSIIDLGNGANLTDGPPTPCPCDMGFEIGTTGIVPDDIQATTFVLTHTSTALDLSSFVVEDFGVRLMSVDIGGGLRTGSSKMAVPEPATAMLFTLGLFGLAVIGRIRQSD